jgi:hypothetical protein
MALRIRAVCVADHNKDTCGLSFRLTLTDQAANETVHSAALQLARVFPCEWPINEHFEAFDSPMESHAEPRPRPRRIRIFNAFPVGFIYSRLMDGAEAP